MLNDFWPVIQWWLILFSLGLASFPLTFSLFRNFFDSGYGLSKIIGIIVPSYLVFLLSILHILPLSQISIFGIFVVYIFINVFIYTKLRYEIRKAFRKKLKIFLFQEILFIVGLFGWGYVRAHQPEIRGLEKFMDYGFINSILRSEFLPPIDMWAAGNSINYYWFGHLITAVLTKLSAIPGAITYNLMLGTILGFTLSSSFSITTSLLAETLGGRRIKAVIVGGVLSAFLLGLGGNFHTPLYVLKNGHEKYWYPDATRFIGYNPDTNDKTIHEFPGYSYIVSDLHGHLLDLPVVLTFLALLTNFIVFSKDKKEKLLTSLGLGVLTGVMFMTNTWDFGIYLLIAGITLSINNLVRKKFTWDFIFETSKTLLTILVLGLVTASPFILKFSSIAQGVDFVNARTPFWQLAVLWGFPALLTLVFLIKLFKKEVSQSKILVAALLVGAWVLILLPEVIYVKDIYIASHHRANTMFKLTYQGFVIFYSFSGFIIVSFLLSIKRFFFKFLAVIASSAVIASILIYPYFGIKSFYGELKNYKGLDGEMWLSREYPAEYSAILFFRENVAGQPTILEAAGDSYTDFNVISSYSGLPTVSGWFVHEWLWRGSPEFPQARSNDVSQIYLTQNLGEAKSLLTKYKVSFVVVGTFERQKYPTLNEQKFEKIGRMVFSSPGVNIYQVNYN